MGNVGLDRRVVCDLLDFEESVYQAVRRLAAKWCGAVGARREAAPKGCQKLII